MYEKPKSFWGKFAVITAFLTALVSLLTLLSQCPSREKYTPRPSGEFESPVRTDLPQPTSPKMGNHCYDAFGNMRCQLVEPAPIGSSCFCVGQGWGIVGP